MRPGFLDENSSIAYPFLADQGDSLPTYAVVDFGSMMLSGSGYLAVTHRVYLHEVRRIGDLVEFDFRSDATGLESLALVFSRGVDDVEFISEYVDASPIEPLEESSSSAECPDDPLWMGFMVSGDMRRLSTVLADEETIAGPYYLEPSRTQNLDHSYVRSIGVANSERTRATTASDCRDYCWNFPMLDHYVVCECITGDVRFVAGFNADVRLATLENQLVLAAEVGGGLGEPCDEVPLFPGEEPPNGSNLLTGGPSCGEVIRSINGVGRQFLDVAGGTGVTISAIPDAHRLIINVDLHTTALCPNMPEDVPAEALEENSLSCECGDSL